jgi:N-acetylmuramoyl-L-alanine amidase
VPCIIAGSCVSGGAEVDAPIPSLFDEPVTSVAAVTAEVTMPSAPSSTTIPVAERLPDLADDVVDAVITEEGVVLPITGTDGDVWFLLGPCGGDRVEPVATAQLAGARHVVLDPGSDDDDGAGNLAVARRTAEMLSADGIAVVLTRTAEAEIGAATSGLVAPAVGSAVLVSIHRGDGTTEVSEPRPTVFHRAEDSESQRLAGLVHEEVAAAYADVGGVFRSPEEPGVRSLLNQRGEDYFRVLQTSAGVAAARVELLALPVNATTLLTEEEGREIEARALADAIVRFLVTSEVGDGFIDPVEAVRTAPTSNAPGGC